MRPIDSHPWLRISTIYLSVQLTGYWHGYLYSIGRHIEGYPMVDTLKVSYRQAFPIPIIGRFTDSVSSPHIEHIQIFNKQIRRKAVSIPAGAFPYAIQSSWGMCEQYTFTGTDSHYTRTKHLCN